MERVFRSPYESALRREPAADDMVRIMADSCDHLTCWLQQTLEHDTTLKDIVIKNIALRGYSAHLPGCDGLNQGIELTLYYE